MDLIETGLKADTDDAGCLQDLKENLPNYKTKDGGGVQGEDWFNFVYYQVEKGNMEDLKEWIEAGGNINKKIQEKGLEGITLLELNCGVKKNDINEEDLRLKIATYLIEKGCDVNLFNYVNGFTPLMQAVSSNYPSIVEKLISAGANVFYCNSEGQDALICACIKGYT